MSKGFVDITQNTPGQRMLLMGNEAIARGALEAGVSVASAYPGTPSSEILGTLAGAAKIRNLYVEWSANEKVALEVAASASFSGLRAICAMKQNGLNVACDFLLNLNLIGVDAGLVLVVCDDPSSHSSTNEQDSRTMAKIADLPLLEPATWQEAKEMAVHAFEISEQIKNVCMVRGVTRIAHARGSVTFSGLPDARPKAFFDKSRQRITFPVTGRHQSLHDQLAKLSEQFSDSPFNWYEGPDDPELVIICCGSGWLNSQEAVEILGLNDKVGILKLGTTWPLPTRLVLQNLNRAGKFMFIEEVDPFLERSVKELAAQHSMDLGPKVFLGKESGLIPATGEVTPDRVMEALSEVFDLRVRPRSQEYEQTAKQVPSSLTPARVLGFCPGCPHRASYWSINKALQLDGRQGFVTGDIGCYHLARTSAGYNLLKTSGAMGTGTGLASGFGKLDRFGFDQPVVAVCGDSTFYHAAIPALINARYNNSKIILAVLDNSATSMTGFQPHPGVGMNACGEQVEPVDIEKICKAIGGTVEVVDPFDLEDTQEKLTQMLDDPEGSKVIIMRRKCALLKDKDKSPRYQMEVIPELCKGADCGCDRFCVRIFKCPGLVWDHSAGKAFVDEAICSGCGVCADICPNGAISRKEQEHA